MSSSNTPVVLQASKALDKFKYEIAKELGFNDWATNATGYFGYVSSRDNGAIGGHMVRRMVEAAEKSLMEQALGSVNTSFAQGYSQASQTPSTSFPQATAGFPQATAGFPQATAGFPQNPTQTFK